MRLANGEVGSGTYEQLVEAFSAGHLDEGMMVLEAGATEWARLGAVMERRRLAAEPQVRSVLPAPSDERAPTEPSSPPSRSSEAARSLGVDGSGELWQARLPDGQVRSGTRQQLEDAVRAAHLDENVLVLPAGASEWVKLGSILGDHPSVDPPAASAAVEPLAVREPLPRPDASVQPALAPDPVREADAVREADPALAAKSQDPISPPQLPPMEPLPDSPSTGGSDALWQVKLTGKQVEAALRAGWLGDDTPILVAGSDQWVRFSDLRGANQGAPRVPVAAKGPSTDEANER